MSEPTVYALSKLNPRDYPGRYCQDCAEFARYYEEVQAPQAEPRADWVEASDRLHLVERGRRSNKYPDGTGPYYVCGRRR